MWERKREIKEREWEKEEIYCTVLWFFEISYKTIRKLTHSCLCKDRLFTFNKSCSWCSTQWILRRWWRWHKNISYFAIELLDCTWRQSHTYTTDKFINCTDKFINLLSGSDHHKNFHSHLYRVVWGGRSTRGSWSCCLRWQRWREWNGRQERQAYLV